jgi:hypothetical protein
VEATKPAVASIEEAVESSKASAEEKSDLEEPRLQIDLSEGLSVSDEDEPDESEKEVEADVDISEATRSLKLDDQGAEKTKPISRQFYSILIYSIFKLILFYLFYYIVRVALINY